MSRRWAFVIAVPAAIVASSVLALVISPPDPLAFFIDYVTCLGISGLVLALVFWGSLRKNPVMDERGMTTEERDRDAEG